MKKYLIIFTLIIFSVSIICIPGIVNAETKSASDAISGAESFINTGKNESIISTDNLRSVSNTIYNVLLSIGVCVAVVGIAIIGTKTLFGSIEEKAQYKEMLLPFVIGAVVVFGAFGIWKAVVTILKTF